MSKPGMKLLGRKFRLGRLAVPIWGVAIGVAVVGVAAGQAVGPVLSGSTTGSVNLTVEQAIALDTDYSLGANPLATGDDAVSARNDEGTSFTVAIELHTGETETVSLFLENSSGNAASAILELNVPAGIDVELEEVGTGVDEAQLTANSWLMTLAADTGNPGGIPAAAGEGVVLTIEPKDDIKPGFYTITGRIKQVAG